MRHCKCGTKIAATSALKDCTDCRYVAKRKEHLARCYKANQSDMAARGVTQERIRRYW